MAAAAERRVANLWTGLGHEALGRRLHDALVSGIDDEGTVFQAVVLVRGAGDLNISIESLVGAQAGGFDLVADRTRDAIFGSTRNFLVRAEGYELEKLSLFALKLRLVAGNGHVTDCALVFNGTGHRGIVGYIQVYHAQLEGFLFGQRHQPLGHESLRGLPGPVHVPASDARAPDPQLPGHPERHFLPPDLLQRDGPWVEVTIDNGSRATASRHVYDFGARSAFRVFLHFPEGRPATVAYFARLRDFPRPWVLTREPGQKRDTLVLNPALPQFPVGAQAALVRRYGRLTEREE